jgi:ABC-type transport system substrate-binding protein
MSSSRWLSDYKAKDYIGMLAESWEFQGNRWIFKLRKGVKFTITAIP